MSVPLVCPTHRKPLSSAADGLRCPDDGELFPLADGIPVLLPGEAERSRVLHTDWSQSPSSSPLDFYNQKRDQTQYCRQELLHERADIQRWLDKAQTDGPTLEIGSGRGALQGLGGDYVAADYSFTALRDYIDPAHQRVCATAERLPFPDASIRFIFSIAALEHVPGADRAFDEIDRVLKPGGIAYLHPAWHCTQYNCEGIPVRAYKDLSWRQRGVKLSLPLRRIRAIKAAAALPGRIIRRASWILWRRPTSLHFHRLRPDYQTFWASDADAASRLDSHEGCLYFQSRGYQVLFPGGGTRQLLAGNVAVIVRKPLPAKGPGTPFASRSS